MIGNISPKHINSITQTQVAIKAVSAEQANKTQITLIKVTKVILSSSVSDFLRLTLMLAAGIAVNVRIQWAYTVFLSQMFTFT